MTVTNFIDSTERQFLETSILSSYGDLWRSPEFTIEPSTSIYQDASFGSLKLYGASSGSLFYNDWESPAVDTPSQFAVSGVNDLNDEIVSFVWVRPTQNCVIRMRNIKTIVTYDASSQTYVLSTNPADRVEGEWGVHSIALGVTDSQRWHLIRARMLAMTALSSTTRYALGFELEISYDDTVGECYVSRPTITALMDVVENSFFLESMALIPEVYLSQDFLDPTSNEVQFPLLRFLDVLTHTSGDVQDTVYEYEYKNESQGLDEEIPETNSFLLTPQLVSSLDQLNWLAQFRGRELVVTYEPSTEGEAWEKFILDTSLLDGTSVLALSSFSVEGISGGVETYFKWQVDTGYYGHNAGTIDAMVSAIQLLLSGSKTVNYTVAANEITFETSITETYGSDTLGLLVGDENPYVIQIIEPARPLGMIVNHELVA